MQDYRKLLEILSNAEHDELLDNIDNAIHAISELLGMVELANIRASEAERLADVLIAHKPMPECFGHPIDRVIQLVEADKAGRCIVLPVKPPCTAWTTVRNFPMPVTKRYLFPSEVLQDMEKGLYIARTKSLIMSFFQKSMSKIMADTELKGEREQDGPL